MSFFNLGDVAEFEELFRISIKPSYCGFFFPQQACFRSLPHLDMNIWIAKQ